MKRSQILLSLMLVGVILAAAPAASAAGSTYIGSTDSATRPSNIRLPEYTEFRTFFKIKGSGRSNFNDRVWALAYPAGWTSYSVTYTISVRKDISYWFDEEVLSPTSYRRTATIVPSTKGSYGFWVEIRMEDGRTEIPDSVSEAQSLMFDLQKDFQMKGYSLGRGSHKLFAECKAKWSGYKFSGTDVAQTPRALIQVRR